MSSSPHAPLYSSWTTPQLPFLTPYRCQSVVTPNVRRARPPGHVHVVYLSSPPRCTLPFRLGQVKHASTSRASTDLIPGPPSASHRCRPVPSFCRAPCWQPKTVLSSRPLTADQREHVSKVWHHRWPRIPPPSSPNGLPPPPLFLSRRTGCTMHRAARYKTWQPSSVQTPSPPDRPCTTTSPPGGQELPSSL
jgi:hypothetical protein